jgi:hypothetical protein
MLLFTAIIRWIKDASSLTSTLMLGLLTSLCFIPCYQAYPGGPLGTAVGYPCVWPDLLYSRIYEYIISTIYVLVDQVAHPPNVKTRPYYRFRPPWPRL